MKLMILDGNSIINRAFYGIRPLTAPDGTPTNAVYGFLAILQRMLDEQKPDAVCVSFDLKAPTFRHKSYEGYKAQRKPMPEELAVQMPILKETLDAMGIRRYELEGYEADDILGTAAAICESKGWECVIVTGDKDSLQLITDTTTVCNVKTRMGQTETINYTPVTFKEEYGFEPKRMVDLKALMGDSSDNIPGVPGVGEKTAMSLIQTYGSLEKIYDDLASLDIKDGVRKKLAAGEESARMSYSLATIFCHVPVSFEPEENIWNNSFSPGLYDQLKRLGFNKFIEKWHVEPVADRNQKVSTVKREQITVDSGEKVESFLKAIEAEDHVSVFCIDGIENIDICTSDAVYSISWAGCGDDYNRILRAIFCAEIKKVSSSVKDIMGMLIKENLPLDGFVFDTALVGYLLDATGNDYSAGRLSMKYLGRDINGAEALYELYPVLNEKLKEYGVEKLYFSVELPLCRVLADMEHAGFFVDKKALYEYGESLNAGIDSLQQSIWNHAGHSFNINSPKQLGEVLFEELMLPSGKKTKTGWSTSADVLEKLSGKHEIVDEVLEYRMLTKLKSTYADGLLKVISEDGRIHTSFQMTVTATGRLSSTEPNLQNVPVRKKLGAQIRNMFVASPGMSLVDADYSQIELRILAHISDDKTMQQAFMSGEDFHSVTASNVFNVPLNEVDSTLRSRAKAVNFGIVYGISSYALSQSIGVWPSEAKEYMDAYMAKYHGVRDYMKSIVEKAKEDGYVSTIYGRRRELPELKSSNFNMRSFGERVALNMPIQGTAADIIKIAMVNVYDRLKREGLQAKLILQVHDELIVECPEAEAEQVKDLLLEEMENAASLAVPLTVDVHCGHSWAEAH